MTNRTATTVTIRVGGLAGLRGEVIKTNRHAVLVAMTELPNDWPVDRSRLWFGLDEVEWALQPEERT